MTTTPAPTLSSTTRPAPIFMQIAAWSIPVLLLGQFAMVALVPVLIVAIGSFTNQRARYLRWWTVGVAVLYAVPLTILNVRPDPAQSLSKDMHPIFLALIVLASVALLVRMYVRSRR